MAKNQHLKQANDAYSSYASRRVAATSLDFGQLTPVMCDEVLEKDRWNFSLRNSLEVAPLAVKTRNDVYYNQASFFVGNSMLDSQWALIRSRKDRHLGASVPTPLRFSYAEMFNALFAHNRVQVKWLGSGSQYQYQVVGNADPDLDVFDRVSVTTLTNVPVNGSYDDAIRLIKKDLNTNYAQYDVKVVILYTSSVPSLQYCAFGLSYNKRGQALRKIFDGLGYKMPLVFIDGTAGSGNSLPQHTSFRNFELKFPEIGLTSSYSFQVGKHHPIGVVANPYPLLAYLKIYEDYFSMSSVKDENPVALFLEDVYYRSSSALRQSSYQYVDCTRLLNCFLQISLQLHSDDVTRCTRRFYENNNPFYSGYSHVGADIASVPMAPQNSTQPGTLMSVAENHLRPYNGTTTDDYAQLDYAYSVVEGNHSLPCHYQNHLIEIAHRMLLTTKFIGSKTTSLLRAFFGISDPIEDAKHSIKIASKTMPLQIDGLLIQSNTYNGSNVDDDAGTKIGTAYGNGMLNFGFVNKYGYGYGITLNWLSVRTVYANRSPRFVFKHSREDLYNGMYDGHGFSQCVPQLEINTDSTDASQDRVFGEEPLYEEYRKLGIDFFSGDILRVSGMKSYLIPRDFRGIVNEQELYAEFSAVRSVRQSSDEFSDMFIAKDGYDPVLVFCDVNVMATRNIQDSDHALAIPIGSMSVEVQHNMA